MLSRLHIQYLGTHNVTVPVGSRTQSGRLGTPLLVHMDLMQGPMGGMATLNPLENNVACAGLILIFPNILNI